MSRLHPVTMENSLRVSQAWALEALPSQWDRMAPWGGGAELSPFLWPPGRCQQARGERVLLWAHCGDVAAPLWQGSQAPARPSSGRLQLWGQGNGASIYEIMFYQVSIFRTKPRKKSTHHGGVEWGGRADGVGALLGSPLQMKRGSCIWGTGGSLTRA